VVELDPEAPGLLCLEEPENGIHPERIPAMLQLLQDIAVDEREPVGPDNSLRQVIVNTHSPAVVGQVPDDSLLIAELRESAKDGKRFTRVSFACLPGNWREKAPEGMSTISRGKLLAYLNPILGKDLQSERPRVVDRSDLQMLLPYADQAGIEIK
jgi:hypothetical protein